MGVFSFTSRLPQYLIHAIFEGAVCVAEIEGAAAAAATSEAMIAWDQVLMTSHAGTKCAQYYRARREKFSH